MPYGSSYLSPDRIAKLSTICGVPAPDLARRQTSGASGSNAQILGSPLQRQYVKATLSRMCLHCAEDKAYHHLAWSLLPVSHCPIHSAPIVDTCPTCDVPLEWHRPRLLRCRNDHDIRLRRPGTVRQGGQVDLAGIRAIYEHCGFDHGGAAVLTEAPAGMPRFGENRKILLKPIFCRPASR